MSARLPWLLFAVACVTGCAATPTPQIPAAVPVCPAHAKKESPPPAAGSSADVSAALQGLPILSVNVRGLVIASVRSVLGAAALPVGSRFDRAAVARAIVAIYNLGEFDDVQIMAAPEANGANVEVVVRERAFVATIHGEQMDPADRDVAAAALGLAEGRRLDVAELHLRARAEGGPAVDWEIVPQRGNRVDVCLYPRSR